MLYFRRNQAQVGMVRVKPKMTIHFQYLMDWIEHVALLFANVSSQCTYNMNMLHMSEQKI